ncbi:unnamed protein product [Euphydryas editha]|uniref:PHD-type domain-containing protein n=1 Tax=Euphydryas editha TaxID=104508 RepID=A0AAU9UWV1_EUPED|nr:unnamed protein product [Euphydryas editha]
MSFTNKILGCCEDNNDSGDFLECVVCRKAYHLDCLSLSKDVNLEDLSEWECPLCTTQRHKESNNDNTPVRFNPNVTMRACKRQALQSPPSTAPTTLSEGDIQNMFKELTLKISSKIDSLSTSISSELKMVKEEMTDMRTSMDFMNSKFESLLQEHEETKKAMVEIQKENSILKSSVNDLNMRINALEQNARSSNVEIQCLPEQKTENLTQIVTQLGAVIGCPASQDQIIHCSRVAKMKPNSSRPRSVIVQFASMRTRDEFLAASINFNRNKSNHEKLNSSHLALKGEKTAIFITEHLSPTNKMLNAAARSTAKEKGYKHVWVRNGKIFMRKTDGSNYILVRDLNALKDLK